MSVFVRSTALAKAYTKNLARTALGVPASYPALGSMTLDEEDVAIARRFLRDQTDWGWSGYVSDYEKRFADWNGSRHAFAFMSGRVALSACVHAVGLGAGDEVIVPGYTCVVVPNAFEFAGVNVVFCDIELETYGLDVRQLKERVTRKTKAVVLHHLYGLVSRDYEAVVDFCREQGLAVIEDCAQATGAEYRGRRVGLLGDAAFYSSEQSKVFNTVQGGIAVTDSDEVAHGLRDFYESAPLPTSDWIEKQLHNVVLNFYESKHRYRAWTSELVNLRYGHKALVSTTNEELEGRRPAHYGRRMPSPIAALGFNQLTKIDRYNQLRRAKAREWDVWCSGSGYKAPLVVKDSVPVYLRYPILVEPERKADTTWAMRELGVRLGVWFETNAHPAQRTVEGCPNADRAVRSCVNLPTLERSQESSQVDSGLDSTDLGEC